MATDILTLNFALSKFYCRGASPRKTAFWTIFLSALVHATLPQKRKIYFYCRLRDRDTMSWG